MPPVLRPRPQHRRPPPPPESDAIFIFFEWEKLTMYFDCPESLVFNQKVIKKFLKLAKHHEKLAKKCRLMITFWSLPSHLRAILEAYFEIISESSRNFAGRLKEAKLVYKEALKTYVAPIYDEDDYRRYYPIPTAHEIQFMNTLRTVFYEANKMYGDKEKFLKRTLQSFGFSGEGGLAEFRAMSEIYMHNCTGCDKVPSETRMFPLAPVQNTLN